MERYDILKQQLKTILYERDPSLLLDVYEVIDKSSHWEDLEEQGKLYVCGYAVIQEDENEYAIEYGIYSTLRENVFITRTEAQARLAELEVAE